MTEYTETQADEDDTEGMVLAALSLGQPYAFVVAKTLDPLDIKVAASHDVDVLRPLLNKTLRALPGGSDEISDGYHTFGDLYDHRRALTAALAMSLPSWRSKAHHPEDSPMFEGGYFIIGIDLPTGTITYHYKLSHWDDFSGVDELEHAPKWDGLPPSGTVDRLLEWAHRARNG